MSVVHEPAGVHEPGGSLEGDAAEKARVPPMSEPSDCTVLEMNPQSAPKPPVSTSLKGGSTEGAKLPAMPGPSGRTSLEADSSSMPVT